MTPTASSLPRVIECPSSEALPQVNQGDTEYSERGTWRHRFFELVSQGMSADEALDDIPAEFQEECAGIDIDRLPKGLASEVAFAYDYKTGVARELGRGINRDYSSCSPTEIPGTVDILGVSDDAVYVGDLKGFEWVSARDNAQLLFGALCACRIYGKSKAIVEIINIGGETRFNRDEIDEFDLDIFAAKLAQTMDLVWSLREENPAAALKQGKWCKYCPSFQGCPAKVGLLKEMVATTPDTVSIRIDADTAPDVYRRYLMMKDLTKRVGEALHGYAKQFPFETRPGYVFGPREKRGNEQLSGDVVYRVVREILGQEAADMAVKRTATKTDIDKAIKAAKKSGKVEGTLKDAKATILEAVRVNGGADRKIGTVVDEHRAEVP